MDVQAVRSTYCDIHRGSWSNAQAREYLRTCNVKSSTVELVIKIADSDKAEGIFNPDNAKPQFWKLVHCFSTFKFPTLTIHGLCHGIIPDIMSIIHQIFKKYRKITSFCLYANHVLDNLACFGLD